MKVEIDIESCDECPKHFVYRAPGESFCTHHSHSKEKLICHGFVGKGIPSWCPLRRKDER